MGVEILYYIIAAFFEILGCYLFWIVFVNGKNYDYLGLGVLSLIAFAFILTRVESEFAGRAYAAYGGIYIISSILWLVLIEKESVSKLDIIGATMSVAGAMVIISQHFRA